MGYFRDITTGQSLEDVDISVHCDVTIFEWLMAWIKNQEAAALVNEDSNCDTSPKGRKLKPTLEPSNVVSILVSASFLKMDPLVEIGLRFVHENMNKILLATHNLNCLGEPLLSRYY